MAKDGVLITRQGVETLRRDHQKLRGMIHQLRTRLRNRSDVRPPKSSRLGITCKNDAFPDYPKSGNTFVVELERWTFDEEPGDRSITYERDKAFVVARTYDGSFIEEGTHVVIDRHEGMPGRRWWIRKPEVGSSSSSSSTSSSSASASSSSSSSSVSLSSSSSSSLSSISLSSSSSSAISSSSSSLSSLSSSSSSSSCPATCHEVEVVTNVECINGNIVVTKKKLRICGDNLCVDLV